MLSDRACPVGSHALTDLKTEDAFQNSMQIELLLSGSVHNYFGGGVQARIQKFFGGGGTNDRQNCRPLNPPKKKERQKEKKKKKKKEKMGTSCRNEEIALSLLL